MEVGDLEMHTARGVGSAVTCDANVRNIRVYPAMDTIQRRRPEFGNAAQSCDCQVFIENETLRCQQGTVYTVEDEVSRHKQKKGPGLKRSNKTSYPARPQGRNNNYDEAQPLNHTQRNGGLSRKIHQPQANRSTDTVIAISD